MTQPFQRFVCEIYGGDSSTTERESLKKKKKKRNDQETESYQNRYLSGCQKLRRAHYDLSFSLKKKQEVKESKEQQGTR